MRSSARVVLVLVVVVVVVVAQGSHAHAGPADRVDRIGRRAMVDTPVTAYRPIAKESNVLYLDRCVGGCMVTGSNINDATMQTSTIPKPGSYLIHEFSNVFGQVGAMGTCLIDSTTPCTADAQCPIDTGNQPTTCDTADYEWAAVMKCMTEVYSPYAVTVTDVLPSAGYTEAIIAGQPGDIGQANDILGIAPLAGDCSAQNNVISFTFANHHPAASHAINVCWTAAQESAHAYGLDHEYQFTDGSSACNDPMTYRADCGGEKFFRNIDAKCGEYAVRGCRCTATQNSNQKLLAVFGAGTPITSAPTVTIVAPTGGQITNQTAIHASAGAQRGVVKVELWLNGSKWSQVGGAPFGPDGQGNPAAYTLNLPAGVPDSIIDIVTKAYDDLGVETDSAVVTVVKGKACADASTCAKDQKCDAGKCYWDAPTADLGASCAYPQFCKSWECIDTGGGAQCVQDCQHDIPTSCPSGYSCEDVGSHTICMAAAGGGCCSADGHGLPSTAIAFGVLAFVLRRRR